MGRLGFLVAGLVSMAVYLLVFGLVRRQIYIPTIILAPMVLVPALVPGILIGLAVNRLPQVVKLHCSKCHWVETLSLPRGVARARLRARRSMPTMTQVGTARVMPQPDLKPAPQTSVESSPFDQIADDRGKHAEIRAWIYAEFVSGRSYDDIFGEMIAGGWEKEDAEALVEEGRRATRNRRP
jgi:hypothetical protein